MAVPTSPRAVSRMRSSDGLSGAAEPSMDSMVRQPERMRACIFSAVRLVNRQEWNFRGALAATRGASQGGQSGEGSAQVRRVLTSRGGEEEHRVHVHSTVTAPGARRALSLSAWASIGRIFMRVEYVAALTLIAHVAVWRWSGFSKCSHAALTRDHDSPVKPRARKDLQVRAAAAASTGSSAVAAGLSFASLVSRGISACATAFACPCCGACITEWSAAA